MQQRLQVFYFMVAALSALAFAGTVVLHFVPNWVTYPNENGTPRYGLWKACTDFHNTGAGEEESSQCRRYC